MHSIHRRHFLTTASASAVAFAAPALLTAKRASGRAVQFGNDDFRFEFNHEWAQLPDKYSWQTTHNVAVDSAGLVYVIHEGRAELKDHPSIFVFDPDGQFVRAFGNQFQGGGHGIEVRQEPDGEYLYVAAYQQVKSFAKLTLDGETVWERYAPMESGVYAAKEDTERQKIWGRDRFMPTNFAFLPFDDRHHGDFFLADGYGSFFIHRYDKDGNWKCHFGGPGDQPGTFNTPHGLWIDDRQDEWNLVVTDRANHQLQILDLDGNHQKTCKGYGLPANVDRWQDWLLVPELLGAISLVNPSLEKIATIGNDRERIEADGKFAIRQDPAKWLESRFVHPHDACFDLEGNILVAEWVASGRVSKLTRLS